MNFLIDLFGLIYFDWHFGQFGVVFYATEYAFPLFVYNGDKLLNLCLKWQL